ncbi:MAG TPA: AbrB/MazE/SpoVT family DNA-binding domain-containing protein [Gemmataceae bacterium]|nr:AbrB/MazE/SpoVT family DNA-binding domain-containing protein [Gemmataceae bacterium]
MTTVEPSQVGEQGTVILPAELRQRYGLVAGSFVVAEAREEGILLRPAAGLPGEAYTPERNAEFILGSAIDGEDYFQAIAEVRAMGLNPEKIPHHKPAGV